VCYSWWVLTSLRMLGRMHWIDQEKLKTFILACQDAEDGGASIHVVVSLFYFAGVAAKLI